MKKLLSVMMILVMVLCIAGCGSSGSGGDSGEAEAQQEATGTSEALVVYFSHTGNTESVANAIQEQTGSDIYEIVPSAPYTDDYDELLDLAQNEQEEDARPEISEAIDDFEKYQVVYVGHPIWWGDMPMILYSFFDSYDMAGKTIVPFCTSGGSGLCDTVNAIQELEPEAQVMEGLHIGDGEASNPGEAVSGWLEDIGL